MFKRLWVFLTLALFAAPTFAIGVTIVAAVTGVAFASFTTGMLITAAVINMVVSAAIGFAFQQATQPNSGYDGASNPPDTGNRIQISPNTSNKLPVIYGTAWTGGIITDMSITENNQVLYYVLSLCEVTGINGTPDTITFGDIYYGGKKVVFQSNGHTVAKLIDEGTGIEDTTVNGKIDFYLYSNGSNSPTNNGTTSAITIMQSSGLTYKWDSTKLMSNCAFVIIRLKYSNSANIRGINSTKIQVTNSRTKPGDVILDYMQSERYGCAIPADQINTATLTALNAYSDAAVGFDTWDGSTSTIPRYRFDGQIDTARNCMDNLQDMMNSCDSILRYNEILGEWGVIVNKSSYTVVTDINDSNMVSALTINPSDIASSYNYVEVKFPDKNNQDAFNTANFDLAQIAPELLYPNEPVNKVSVNLPFVNSNVRAQLIAQRMLKAAREDLQVTAQVNFVGLQYEAGDVVTVTNANYGWVAKLFRLNKVTESFAEDGSIVVKLIMSEFNPDVYNDVTVTEFSPSPNTGIGDPTFFGNCPIPVVVAEYPSASNPSFVVRLTTPPSGITQYMEVWYSAYATPTESQLYFAGTSEIQSNGDPWDVSTALPNITLSNIPAGDWYFFARAVNSLSASAYSSNSSILRWRPSTYQFTERYVTVAYADSITGSGFSLLPTGKSYYGLCNQDNISPSTDPSVYTWYLAEPTFGTAYFLCYSNRTGRKFSFDTGLAAQAAGSGAFVPTVTGLFDPSIWSALPNGTNYIDLDERTGQLLETGSTTVGTGEIAVRNTQDGRVVASLQEYLNFGTGVYTYTSSVATLTVDIYGRVVGFEPPNDFYYSEQQYTATAGQTVFSVTRGAGYIPYQCWVMVNGEILEPVSDYTDTATTVTLTAGVDVDSKVEIISFKSVNATSGVYDSFTREDVILVDASSYTPTSINSGFEFLFCNGIQLSELDYDIVDGVITNFPSVINGTLTIIQWSPNNLNQPNGTPVNVLAYTVSGQALYPFSYNPAAFNLYENGVYLTQGTDFTTSSGNYTLIPTPDGTNVLVQQTFARTGAV